MKALCVRQPWASLIAAGVKTLEVRSRTRKYRGPLVIVASGTSAVSDHGRAAAARHGLDLDTLPRGAALCVVTLADARPMTAADEAAACCPFEPGAIAWVLDDARAFSSPMPMRGKLSFFPPPDAVVQAAQELLERPAR